MHNQNPHQIQEILKINSLALPGAPPADVTEVVETEGALLFFPLPQQTKNKSSSWILERVHPISPDEIRLPTDTKQLFRYLGTYSLEIAMLLSAISEASGTPVALGGCEGMGSADNKKKLNLPVVQRMYKFTHGEDQSFPSSFKYCPMPTPTELATATVEEPVITSAATSSVLKPNLTKFVPNLPWSQTSYFNTSIAEAIYQVEAKIPSPTNKRGGSDSDDMMTTMAEEDQEDDDNNRESATVDEQEPEATATSSRKKETKKKKAVTRAKRYDSVVFPWNFKSRVSEEDSFVYTSWNQVLGKKIGRYPDDDDDELFSEDGAKEHQQRTTSSTAEDDFSQTVGEYLETGAPTSEEIPKLGHLGFDLERPWEVPKMFVYLIDIPKSGGNMHRMIAVRILDPHFDAVSLYKWIQQRKMESHSLGGSSTSSSRYVASGSGRSSMDPEVKAFYKRTKLEPYCVSGLKEGFHNEGVIYKNVDVNPSLADDPKLFFRFLCDYYQASSAKPMDPRTQRTTKVLREQAQNFADHHRDDRYMDILHALNPRNLFTFERAMTILSKLSAAGDPYVSAFRRCIRPISAPPVSGGTDDDDGSVPRSPVSWSPHFRMTFDEDARNLGIRCRRYSSASFRWCFWETSEARLNGLITQIMPHDIPVFQLNDDTYTAAVLKSRGTTDTTTHDEDVIMDEEEARLNDLFDEMVGRSNHKTKFKATRWTNLKEIGYMVAFDTALKALPNNKLFVLFNSYLMYLSLVDKYITQYLDVLKPVGVLSFKDLNACIEERELSNSLKSFLEENNSYVAHTRPHYERMIKFTNQHFFNYKIVDRMKNLVTDGWYGVVKYYHDLEEKSGRFARHPAIDPLRPSYYKTMRETIHMRGRNDSVIGSFLELTARRVYEQLDLYQNNTVYFTALISVIGDLFRMDGQTKTHLYLAGPCATGKSHLLDKVAEQCIEHTVYFVQDATANAFAGTGYVADQLMLAPENMNLLTEFPELMKAALTDGNTTKATCTYDPDTNIRSRADHKGGFYLALIVASNKILQEAALASRFYQLYIVSQGKITEEKTESSPTEETKKLDEDAEMAAFCVKGDEFFDRFYLGVTEKKKKKNAKETSNDGMENGSIVVPINTMSKKIRQREDGLEIPANNDIQKEQAVLQMKNYNKYVQMILFYLHKLEAQGVICKTSTHVLDMFIQRVQTKINRIYPWAWTINRKPARVKNGAKNLCVYDAIRRVFFDPNSVYYNGAFKPEYVRALEPYLSVTFEHCAISLSLFAEEIVDDIKSKIILAFLKRTKFYQYCLATQGGAFSKLEDYSSTDPVTGRQTLNLTKRFLEETGAGVVKWCTVIRHETREAATNAPGVSSSAPFASGPSATTTWGDNPYQPTTRMCYDLNGISLSRRSPSKQWDKKARMQWLMKDLKLGGLCEMTTQIFEKEIEAMCDLSVQREFEYELVQQSVFEDVGSGELPEHPVKLIKRTNPEPRSLLSFSEFTTSRKDGGEMTCQVTLDVQALKYLYGTNLIKRVIQEVAAEMPLENTRIPLMFHLPGARLVDIEVGTRDDDDDTTTTTTTATVIDDVVNDQTTNSTKKKKIHVGKTVIDPYRNVVDYGGTNSASNSNNEDDTHLSPNFNINSYGRLKHILEGHFLPLRYSKNKVLQAQVTDYTTNTTKWVPVKSFFEHERRKKLWESTLSELESANLVTPSTNPNPKTTPSPSPSSNTKQPGRDEEENSGRKRTREADDDDEGDGLNVLSKKPKTRKDTTPRKDRN